jgi:hypothetical protein
MILYLVYLETKGIMRMIEGKSPRETWWRISGQHWSRDILPGTRQYPGQTGVSLSDKGRISDILIAKTSFGKSMIPQYVSALKRNTMTIMIIPLTELGKEQLQKIQSLPECRPVLRGLVLVFVALHGLHPPKCH